MKPAGGSLQHLHTQQLNPAAEAALPLPAALPSWTQNRIMTFPLFSQTTSTHRLPKSSQSDVVYSCLLVCWIQIWQGHSDVSEFEVGPAVFFFFSSSKKKTEYSRLNFLNMDSLSVSETFLGISLKGSDLAIVWRDEFCSGNRTHVLYRINTECKLHILFWY